MSKLCPIYKKAIYMDCLECEEKECKKTTKQYKKIVIGIDQSYKNTGISISADGKLLKVKSVSLEKLNNNTERREKLRKTLSKVIKSVKPKGKEVICIIERIRLRSEGFINIDYIKSIGALNALIVDCFKVSGIRVYSVDTRAWKSQVIGTSKPKANNFGVPDEKWPTVEWVIRKGFESSILVEITNKQKKKGVFERNGKRYMYDNDAADSAGISMFGFVGKEENLKEEH